MAEPTFGNPGDHRSVPPSLTLPLDGGGVGGGGAATGSRDLPPALDKALAVLVALLAFFLPWAEWPKSVLLGMIALVFIALWVSGRLRIRPLTLLDLGSAALALGFGLSLLSTPDRALTLKWWWKTAQGLLVLFAFSRLLPVVPRAGRTLTWSLLVCTAMVEIAAAVEFFASGRRLAATLQDRIPIFAVAESSSAIYMEFLLPVAILIFVHAGSRRERWLAAAGGTVLAAGIALTLSRVGIIIMAMMFLYALARWPKRGLRWALPVLVGLGLWLAIPGGGRERFARDIRGGFRESSLQWRRDLWLDAWNLYKTRPWTGYGLGAFGRQVDPTWSTSAYRHVHNIFLAGLFEAGPAGLVGVSAFVIAIPWAFWRRRRRPYSEAALLAWGALILHGLVEYPIRDEPFIIFCAVLAMASAESQGGPSRA